MKKILLYHIISVFVVSHGLLGQEIRMGTAQQGGGYYEIATRLKSLIEKKYPELRIDIITTNGSIDNVEKIGSGNIDIALVQSDIAFYYQNGEKIFRFPSKQLKGLAALYTEPIHIIFRKDLQLENIRDLIGRQISLGTKRSGTEFNASSILNEANITYQDIYPHFLSIDESIRDFNSKKIDAIILTTGMPSAILEKITEKYGILGFDTSFISKLRATYPFFVGTTIEKGTYPNQKSDVFTVGVKALLVTHSELDSSVCTKILNAIFSSNIKTSHPYLENVNISNALEGMKIDLLWSAKEFYQEHKIVRKSYELYIIGITILVLVAFFFILRHFFYKFKIFIRNNDYLRYTLFLTFLFTVGTFGTYCYERRINDGFNSLPNTIWTTFIYLISGLEGVGPVSTGGRLFSLLLLIGNITIVASVIGYFVSMIIQKGVKKMPTHIHDHIIICNWNNKGDKIIREIHHPKAQPETEIIVLSKNDLNEEELRQNQEYQNVFFVKGNPIDHQTLENIKIYLAKSVIILSDPETTDPDPNTALVCLAINEVCKNHPMPKNTAINKPHIICEINNHKKRNHIIAAGADEVVSAGLYRTGIMLQSAMNYQLSDVYHQLLEISDNTNEFYIVEKNKYPKFLLGMDFQNLVNVFNKNRNTSNPILLVGIRRGNKVILNPRSKTNSTHFGTLQENDALIVMCYQKPDISKFKL